MSDSGSPLLEAIQKARQIAAKLAQNGPVRRSADEASISTTVKVTHAYQRPITSNIDSNSMLNSGGNSSQGSHANQLNETSGHSSHREGSYSSHSSHAKSGYNVDESHNHNDNNNTNSGDNNSNVNPVSTNSNPEEHSLLRRHRQHQEGQDKTELLIPHAVIGLVIGKKGENIKRIQSETGAMVRVDPNVIDESGNKMCTITGSTEAVQAALIQVKNVIENQKRGRDTRPPRPQQTQHQQQPQHQMLPQQPVVSSPEQAAAWSAYLAQYYAQYQQPGALSHPGLAPQAQIPMLPTTVAAQNPNPAPTQSESNPSQAQADYSAEWINYYRSMGMHDQANAIERMVKQSDPDKQETINPT